MAKAIDSKRPTILGPIIAPIVGPDVGQSLVSPHWLGLTDYYAFETTAWANSVGGRPALTPVGTTPPSILTPGEIGNSGTCVKTNSSYWTYTGSAPPVGAAASQAFGVSFWVKANTTASPGDAILECNTDGATRGNGWGIAWNGPVTVANAVTWIGAINGVGQNIVGPTVVITNWNHYVLTYDGNKTAYLYANGAFAAQMTNAAIGTVGQLFLGAAGTTPAAFSNTALDETGFFNRLLSAADAAYFYNGGAGRAYLT